ncbi:MAG: HWE histidine kinase domain-containing protein [Devosia sp.]
MGENDDIRRFEVAAHAASLGVWDWDLATNIFFFSGRAKEICGFDATAEITFDQVRAVTHPEDHSRTSQMAIRAIDPLLREKVPYRYRVVRADTGETRWVLAHGEAIFEGEGSGGSATRYIGTLQDITAQHNAEQALIESEARLRYAIEAGKMAVWEIDLDRDAITPSPDLNTLCGFPPDAPVSLDDIRSRYAPGEEERIEQEAAALRALGETRIQTTFRQLWPDGTEKWLLLRATAAPPTETIPNRVIGVLIDITAQKLAERKAALIAGEMQHRVKNALSVVQSLAVQSFRNKTDLGEAKDAFLGRVRALSAATETVTSEGWADSDLRELLEVIIAPYKGGDHDAFAVAGPAVRLSKKAATAVSLGLHELCTNAVKYGALSVPEGHVDISWRASAEQVDLQWKESGGPAVVVPENSGFGLSMLTRGLLGPGAVDLSFSPLGVVCRMHVKLAD